MQNSSAQAVMLQPTGKLFLLMHLLNYLVLSLILIYLATGLTAVINAAIMLVITNKSLDSISLP